MTFGTAQRLIAAAKVSGDTTLDLGSLALHHLPAEIGDLSELTCLNVRNNRLTFLPARISNLSKLERIDASLNRLQTLPKSIGDLEQLRELDLYDNEVDRLPASLGNLVSLTELNLESNLLANLPPSVGQLHALEALLIADNLLREIPPEIGLLSELRTLDVCRNRLVEIAPEIGRLVDLRDLRFQRNRLTSLPPEIGRLRSLTHLDVRRNRLTSIPPEIGKLEELEELNLSDNRISLIPPEIGRLQRLTAMKLDRNELKSLPSEIAGLRKLQMVELNDNQLPPELDLAADAGVAVLRPLLEGYSSKSDPLLEGKILFVGEGEVGKSTLLGALRGDPWQENRDYTHGLEVTALPLQYRGEGETEVLDLKLNAWDFGGQPIYRTTHQLFFTRPAIYIVVWKPRPDPKVDDWLRMIRQRAGFGAKALVVATHVPSTDPPADLDEEALRKVYPNLIAGFFSVDSRENDSRMEALRSAIAQEAAALPELRTPSQPQWTQFRNSLTPRTGKSAASEAARPYLRYRELEEAAREVGIDSDSTQAICLLASNSGQWRFYGSKPPAAEDLVVLDPEWLAKAIGFVLKDKATSDRQGILPEGHVREIWSDPERPEEQYAPELFADFLGLMERFDLAYQVEQEGPASEIEPLWLVGQLVGQEPDGQALQEFESTRPGERVCSRVLQVYDPVDSQPAEAEGLLFRAIVRLHQYSLGSTHYERAVHWRKGLLLRHSLQGRAKVTSERAGIRIEAKGARPEWFVETIAANLKEAVESDWHLGADISYPCVAPCGRDEPGTGLVPIRKLLGALREEQESVQCFTHGCDAYLSLERLNGGRPMTNLVVEEDSISRARAMVADIVRDVLPAEDVFDLLEQQVDELLGPLEVLERYLEEQAEHLDRHLHSLPIELADLAAQAQRHMQIYLVALDEVADSGPRLMVPGGYKNLTSQGFTAKSILAPWCERSLVPSLISGPDPHEALRQPEIDDDSISLCRSTLGLSAKLLRSCLPLSHALNDKAMSFEVYEDLKSELDRWVSDLPSASHQRTDAAGRSRVEVTASAIRTLHEAMGYNFGNLELGRGQTPLRMWVRRSRSSINA